MGFFRLAASGPPSPKTLNEVAGIYPTDRPEKTEIRRPSSPGNDDHADLSRRLFHVNLIQDVNLSQDRKVPHGNGVLPTVMRRRDARQILQQERRERERMEQSWPTKRKERREQQRTTVSGSCGSEQWEQATVSRLCGSVGSCHTEGATLPTVATTEEREPPAPPPGPHDIQPERRRLKQERMEHERMERAWTEYDRTKQEERRARKKFCASVCSFDTHGAPKKSGLHTDYCTLQAAESMEEVASRWAESRCDPVVPPATAVGEEPPLPSPVEQETSVLCAASLDLVPAQEAALDLASKALAALSTVKQEQTALSAPSLATALCPGVWDFLLIAAEGTDGTPPTVATSATEAAGSTPEEKDDRHDTTGRASTAPRDGIFDLSAGATAPTGRTPTAPPAPASLATAPHHAHRLAGGGAAYAAPTPLAHVSRLKTRSSVTRERKKVRHKLEELEERARHGREAIERHMHSQ